MRKYILILLLFGCATRKPVVQRSLLANAVTTPLTNRQLTELAASQDLMLQSQQQELQRQDSVISAQAIEIATIKNGFVFMDSTYWYTTPQGIITFKPNIIIDSLTVKYKLSIGIPDTTQKVILSL